MALSKLTTALAATLLFSVDVATAAEGFEAIATDFGDSKPTGVVLPSICIGNFIVPKTMYTFEPAGVNDTNVTIMTNPPDLVESGYDGDSGLIFFKFNQNVSKVAEDAGVLIKFPADQLESINICCTQSAQIKPGFTNFKSLVASTTSAVNASFAVPQAGNLAIISQSKALVNVEAVESETSKIGVLGEEDATVNVYGNITAIACLEGASCNVQGGISDTSQSRGEGASTIKATSCEGVKVKGDSTCETTELDISVKTDSPLVFSGLKEECYGGDDLYGANGPAPTDFPTISPAPTISVAPSSVPTVAPSGSPTAAPTAGAFKQGAFTSVVLSGAVLLLLLAQ